MTAPASALQDIPGGQAVIDWFGRVPRFHDANLLEVSFLGGGSGQMRLHAFNMTDRLDADRHFILEKHAVVHLIFDGVTDIQCRDFDMVPGIIDNMQITQDGERFRVEWEACYGIEGSVTSNQVRVTLDPGKPEKL